MFRGIQPGMGLGTSASKLLAFNLGFFDDVVVIKPFVVKGGKAPAYGLAEDEEMQRQMIIKDDEEVLGLLVNILTSGIL